MDASTGMARRAGPRRDGDFRWRRAMAQEPGPDVGEGRTAVEPSELEPSNVTIAAETASPAESAASPAESSAHTAELKAMMQELLELFNARLRFDARKDEVIGKLTNQVSVLSEEARRAAVTPFL